MAVRQASIGVHRQTRTTHVSLFISWLAKFSRPYYNNRQRNANCMLVRYVIHTNIHWFRPHYREHKNTDWQMEYRKYTTQRNTHTKTENYMNCKRHKLNITMCFRRILSHVFNLFFYIIVVNLNIETGNPNYNGLFIRYAISRTASKFTTKTTRFHQLMLAFLFRLLGALWFARTAYLWLL